MSKSLIPLSELKGRTVVITGAGGFIGKHLINTLKQMGATVIPIDRTKAEGVLRLDVTDQDQINKLFARSPEIEFVIHLAGQKSGTLAKENSYETLLSNLEGTLNLLEACRKQTNLKKIILISSLAVYQNSDAALKEGQPVEADTIYSAAKLTAEFTGLAYWNDFKVPVAIARFSNVFGPGQSTLAVIPSLIAQMKENKNITLGNTHTIRDFIYVEDLVAALLQIALEPTTSGQILNVGTGIGTSIDSIVQILTQKLNFNGMITPDQNKIRTGEKSVVVADISAMKNLTGWSPQVSLQEGLQKCL